MDDFGASRWYAIRRAGSTKPATYRCPLCGQRFPALTEHLLVVPEGDPARRRHAHTNCVMRARRAGRLPLREEVEPRRPRWLSRLLRRSAGGALGRSAAHGLSGDDGGDESERGPQ
jgi:hypothetical protein